MATAPCACWEYDRTHAIHILLTKPKVKQMYIKNLKGPRKSKGQIGIRNSISFECITYAIHRVSDHGQRTHWQGG